MLIKDGCWSGKAMLLLEPTRFLLQVPVRLALLLRRLLVQALRLAWLQVQRPLVLLPSVLPPLALPAF